MTEIKQHEYDLLNEIGQDSLVTQTNLSSRLGIAVGSVNWYIKRLIHRGWVKVSHLDRTRLKYDLTSEGMAVFTQRALLYARDSLKVYGDFRKKAKALVSAAVGRVAYQQPLESLLVPIDPNVLVVGGGIAGIQAALESAHDAAVALLDVLVDDDAELVTIIVGAEADADETARVAQHLDEHHPDVEVEVHHGGQPLYPYLIGVE